MGFRFLKIVTLLFFTSEKPFVFHGLYKLKVIRIRVKHIYVCNITKKA